MNTVTITKTRSGFVNVPAAFMVGDHNPYNDSHLVTVAQYVLPEGYNVLPSQMDTLEIYNTAGGHCALVEHSSGHPQLIDGTRNMPVLAPVEN